MSYDRGLHLANVLLHCQCCTRSFFNCAVNEAAPAHCPVRVGEEDVSLARTQVLEAFGDEAGRREEPVMC